MNELKTKIRAALVACYQDWCIVERGNSFVFLYDQERHFFTNLLSTLDGKEKAELFYEYVVVAADNSIGDLLEFGICKHINPLREVMEKLATDLLEKNTSALDASIVANRIGDRIDREYRNMRDMGDA